MKARALALLPESISVVVQQAAQPLLQAITDMESPRLVFGRVALAGDAAFVVRPHVAGGAGKAALDAACLADSLRAGDIDAGLRPTNRSSATSVSRIVQHSRYLGADLEGRPTERDPRRIIRDYGAPKLLHEVDPTRFAAGMIEVRGASLAFGPRMVLSQISFDVRAGEFVCIVGPSGCGKTTLLRLSRGCLPARGEIRFDGEPVRALARSRPSCSRTTARRCCRGARSRATSR